MTLYTATINGVEELFVRDEDAEGRAPYLFLEADKFRLRYYFEESLTNLHPIETYNPATHKVVLKDASVIEGVTESEILECLGQMVPVTGMGNQLRWKITKAIGKQLTPPRPEEPKGYAILLRANEKGFHSRPMWQKSILTNLWSSSDGDIDVPYSDLINPVIISEGVE